MRIVSVLSPGSCVISVVVPPAFVYFSRLVVVNCCRQGRDYVICLMTFRFDNLDSGVPSGVIFQSLGLQVGGLGFPRGHPSRKEKKLNEFRAALLVLGGSF